jgi:hypothetical protein
MNKNMERPALACDLTAIPPAAREEHILRAPRLFQTAQEVQELLDGYAIRFRNEPGKFMAVAQYIENERLCCPFFHFEPELEPNGGMIWLRLKGGAEVKEMLQSVLLESRGDTAELKNAIRTGEGPELDAIVANTSFPILGNL